MTEDKNNLIYLDDARKKTILRRSKPTEEKTTKPYSEDPNLHHYVYAHIFRRFNYRNRRYNSSSNLPYDV